MDDGGYIHMDVMADFIVFQPQTGQKLLVRFPLLSLAALPRTLECGMLPELASVCPRRTSMRCFFFFNF